MFARFALDQDLDAARAYVADDAEYVTREGTFHGADKWADDVLVQLETWNIEVEVEDVIDAGEGAIILLNKVKRVDRETGEVAWKAWPGVVMRVHDGKVVFFEGYIDRRMAMAALGVEQG